MPDRPISAILAPPPERDNPLTRSVAGVVGIGYLLFIVAACLLTLPWTTAGVPDADSSQAAMSPRYDLQLRTARHIPPSWAWWSFRESSPDSASQRLDDTAKLLALRGSTGSAARPLFLMGTDLLGRDLLVRCLAGGGISLSIGIAAALLSVFLGTAYGAIAGYCGGRIDAFMMRVVDILYGLPSILLIVLLAVAAGSIMENWQVRRAAHVREARAALVRESIEAIPESDRPNPVLIARFQDRAVATFGSDELSPASVRAINLLTLLVAIGGVSWLTMARVVRGQVMSLKARPFLEAARAIGVPLSGIFSRHLLPNLLGPIIVYATLTVPQAILQESFLSFLGIGVKAPIPSWGNLAAEGLVELNPYKSHWWLLVFPCLLLGTTLLALNFVGEGLQEALDPRRARR